MNIALLFTLLYFVTGQGFKHFFNINFIKNTNNKLLKNVNPFLNKKWKDIREPLKTPNKTFPISGFYGLIGPNTDYKNISSLYDLFTGDGVIQGVFLENGTANYVR